MDLRLVCLLGAIALLAIPSVAAADHEYAIIEDRFIRVDVEEMDVTLGCGPAGSSQVVGAVQRNATENSFTFHEGDDVARSTPLPPGVVMDTGSGRAVCATVGIEIDLAPGTHHVHVRFDADRRIDQQITLGYHMPQELRIKQAENGQLIESVDIFPWDDGPRDRARFAYLGQGTQPFFPIAEHIDRIGVDWYFEDIGQSTGRDTQSVASGQAFSATVWDPVVEVSSQPHAAEGIVVEERRDGTTLFRDTIIPLTYEPGADRTNLRVRAPLDATFSHVETESGVRWSNTGALPPGGEYGPVMDYIMMERNSAEGFRQVTISNSMMAADGGQIFLVVFTETIELAPAGQLMAFNAVLAAIPLAFAAMALQRICEFQREAFGGYRQTARNLIVTLLMVMAYYVVVVVGAVLAGWFTMASIMPPNMDAVLFYLQILLAMGAFGWLWLTGRAMYRIVHPSGSGA